jgi:class 3 adenylate cyclase
VRDVSSRHGTLINDSRLIPGQSCALREGDTLTIAPWVFQARYDWPSSLERGDETLNTLPAGHRAEQAAIDPELLLRAAIELPAAFGAASSEGATLDIACRSLADRLGEAFARVFIVTVDTRGPHPMACVLASASRRREAGGDVLISRRALQRLLDEPDAVTFISRGDAGGTIAATVDQHTTTVAASLIEHDSAGRPVIIYALGEQRLEGGAHWVAEIVGLLGFLTRQHLLTLRRSRLANYFSPALIRLMLQRDGAARLEEVPQVVEATSLFFDLRGFSLSTEAAAANLMRCHDDFRSISSLVTQVIFEHEGTVIDYAGDGVFAAWGAPARQPDQADRALACATSIVKRLYESDLELIAAARRGGAPACGIGIARGEVLAGPMGSRSQFKYGLLGPSVNLASRLQGLTKRSRLDAAVLLTGDALAALQGPPPLTRRIGRVRPPGLRTDVEVHELVLGRECGGSGATPEQVRRWHELVAAIDSGDPASRLARWRALAQAAAEGDAFLACWAQPILAVAPEAGPWDGVIAFASD